MIMAGMGYALLRPVPSPVGSIGYNQSFANEFSQRHSFLFGFLTFLSLGCIGFGVAILVTLKNIPAWGAYIAFAVGGIALALVFYYKTRGAVLGKSIYGRVPWARGTLVKV